MILVSSCSCLYPIHLSQELSREWRCSWSSAGRRCSNYIWVINNFIVSYIRGFTVIWHITSDIAIIMKCNISGVWKYGWYLNIMTLPTPAAFTKRPRIYQRNASHVIYVCIYTYIYTYLHVSHCMNSILLLIFHILLNCLWNHIVFIGNNDVTPLPRFTPGLVPT